MHTLYLSQLDKSGTWVVHLCMKFFTLYHDNDKLTIFISCPNSLNKFINTWALMLDPLFTIPEALLSLWYFVWSITLIWASVWDFRQCGMWDQQRLRSACAYAQSDQSLCLLLEYSMNVKLLTEHHLEFLSLKRGCTGSSESTLVKMPHCWKSYAMTDIICSQWAVPCIWVNKTVTKILHVFTVFTWRYYWC